MQAFRNIFDRFVAIAVGAVSSNGQALAAAAVATSSSQNPLVSSVPDGYHGFNKPNTSPFLSITVLGATGDLARNKIFPALFALYYGGNLYKALP